MRTLLLGFPLVACAAAHAQSSVWDVHPQNTIPCTDWIEPGPGCTGEASCRKAIDTDEAIMDGGLLNWSENLFACPMPLDTLGNNIVQFSGFPAQAAASTYISGRIDFHQPTQVDSILITCARHTDGPDSMDIAVVYNGHSIASASVVHQAAIGDQLQTHAIAHLGCVPLVEGSGWMRIYIRAYGGDQGFIFQGMRVVGAACSAVSVPEIDNGIEMVAVAEGVRITLAAPALITITDAAGRLLYREPATAGLHAITLPAGLSIISAGGAVRRFVR